MRALDYQRDLLLRAYELGVLDPLLIFLFIIGCLCVFLLSALIIVKVTE